VKIARWLVPALACLAACGSADVPEPTAADASRGSAHFPGLTLNELHEGRRLYVSRCGSCHVQKRPIDLQPPLWQDEVDAMRGINGVKFRHPEARAIVRYLAIAATAG
jgi:cytochrome c5